MGSLEQIEYREHPSEARCQVCDGWGEMINGSRREGQGLSACPDCFGTGHAAKAPSQPTQPPARPWQAQQPPSPSFDYSQPNTDPWGRTFGNPNFGVDPASNGGVW